MENNQAQTIQSAYMEYYLEHGKAPASIYAFCKTLEIEETEFYAHYTCFSAIEKSVFSTFFTETIGLLEQDENYASYNTKDKLLSFYYTFFELAKANRSYILTQVKGTPSVKEKQKVADLEQLFKTHIANLAQHTIAKQKTEKLQRVAKTTIQNAAWVEFMLVFAFWVKDSSVNFEKTDILIEKAITTTFSVLDTAPVHAITDLGKFLFKEFRSK